MVVRVQSWRHRHVWSIGSGHDSGKQNQTKQGGIFVNVTAESRISYRLSKCLRHAAWKLVVTRSYKAKWWQTKVASPALVVFPAVTASLWLGRAAGARSRLQIILFYFKKLVSPLLSSHHAEFSCWVFTSTWEIGVLIFACRWTRKRAQSWLVSELKEISDRCDRK